MEIDYTKHIGPLEFNQDAVQVSASTLKNLTIEHNRLVDIRREAANVPSEYINSTMSHAFKVSKDESRDLLIRGCEDGIRDIRIKIVDEKRKLRESLKNF